VFKTTDAIHHLLLNVNSKYRSIKLQTYEADETIYRQNETTDYVVSIRSGLIKLEEVTVEGKTRIFFLAGPGHIIGVSSLIAEPMRHNAIALQDVEICKVPIALIKSLYMEQPELCINLMRFWQLNLDLADRSIVNFSTGNLTMRLANLIVFLIHLHIASNNFKSVRLLNLNDMSSLLAVTPETVCRELAKLKRYKILKKLKRQEYLYDFERLKSLTTCTIGSNVFASIK
jgi:CRP-like cAMP-binding protein